MLYRKLTNQINLDSSEASLLPSLSRRRLDRLIAEFDGRRLDDLNWGVYRINDEGEVYPTPFVQCQTLGHALYRYATVYAKKAEAYAVAPLMTDEELVKRLYKDYPELQGQFPPTPDH